MKKSEIWISAILYMALGIVLITLILAAGLPVIKKIKDRNTALQTKELLFQIDKNIKAVYSQGPGSQRPLKIEVRRGQLSLDDLNELLSWKFETSVLLSEPGVKIKEGNLDLVTEKTGIEGTYETTYTLNYSYLLNLTSDIRDFSGTYTLMIANVGSTSDTVEPPELRNIPEIKIFSI